MDVIIFLWNHLTGCETEAQQPLKKRIHPFCHLLTEDYRGTKSFRP